MEKFSREYIRETVALLQALDAERIETLASQLADVRAKGGRLFVLGLGGSAAHASHAVNDFRNLCGWESYCPTENVAELTARINDRGWDSSLSEWLETSRLRAEDAVMILSVGGGDESRGVSTSLIKAMRVAQERKARIFGIVGRDGGATAKMADCCVVIPALFDSRVTPHTEGLCAVVWHLLVSHPRLSRREGKWESLRPQR